MPAVQERAVDSSSEQSTLISFEVGINWRGMGYRRRRIRVGTVTYNTSKYEIG